MKILAIGDIHGQGIWHDILIKYIDDVDRVVFVGDYFDSHEKGITAAMQLYNFKEIMLFRRMYPHKIITLIGNHDYHYLRAVNETYSGYQGTHALEIQAELERNLEDLQVCFVEANYIFCHAGLTNNWCTSMDIDMNNLQESVNDLFRFKPVKFGFRGRDPYGNDITQGPFWVRPESLKEDKLKDYKFVVGHTNSKNIRIGGDVAIIDALGHKQFLIVDTVEDTMAIHTYERENGKLSGVE